MNDESTDELVRAAMTRHEFLAPDVAAVQAAVADRAAAFRRRRVVTRAAGCAVLGAGLVAGGFAVPGLLPGGGQGVAVQNPAAAPSATGTGAYPAPGPAELDAAYAAYFEAGYGWDDAGRLAEAWQLADDRADVKARAGHALLDGVALPIQPAPDQATPPPLPAEARAVDAFFAAGYDYADAVRLAELWDTGTPYDAKVEGGTRLTAGQELPFRP